MARMIRSIPVLLALLILVPQGAEAVGVQAGTVISNVATLSYGTPSQPAVQLSSNAATFIVQQITDVTVVPVSTPLTVTSGPVPLPFTVTNTGNGPDTFNLLGNSTIAGDQFDPILTGVFADTNGNGIYDPGIDQPVTSIQLATDAQALLFVHNTIPAGLNPADTGLTELTATSALVSGAPGQTVAGGGVGGVDVVAGSGGGIGAGQGTYLVSSVALNIVKTIPAVLDTAGGSVPEPGAVVTYQIDVSVTGTGTATAVVITDPIPANTTYKAGTLQLDAAPLSDVVDADAGDVGGTTANTVTVNLGDIPAGSANRVIRFQVTIN